MSIARKRAKVKKKTAASFEKKKKRAAPQRKARAKKKRGKKRPSASITLKKAIAGLRKKIASLKSKLPPLRKRRKKVVKKQKPVKRKKQKPAKRKKRRKKKRIKLGRDITREIAEYFGVTQTEVFLRAFFSQPLVAAQIRDRLVDKGLAELRAGMVQTKESIIMGHLIVAEQLGVFDQRALELAAEYNMSVKEIYDLWFSPPTKF